MSKSDASLSRRITELEQRLRAAETDIRIPRQSPPAWAAPRERWLGRVAVSSTLTTSDEVYAVELLSVVYNDTAAGATTKVLHERGSTINALAWPKRDYQAGAYVIVERIRGTLSGDSYTGEWILPSDRVEIRWGRTVSVSYSFPDLSRAGSSMGTVHPVYEVELGRMPFPAVATGLGERFGHTSLVAATAVVNPLYSAFVADSPQVAVEALSLIGDLHKGQPVLLALEGGRWQIIGPSVASVSRETLTFSSSGWRYSDGVRQAFITGTDRLNVQLSSMLGTGGNGTLYNYHDVKPLSQATWADPAFEIMRRGDYEISLYVDPAVYQYGYLQNGSFNANEFTALASSELLTLTDSSGDTVSLPRGAIHWRSLVTLEWVAGLAPAASRKASWPIQFNYYQRATPLWPATQVVSLNKGDQLRLVLENDPTDFSPAGLLNRGWAASSLYLGVRRLADGLTWIP